MKHSEHINEIAAALAAAQSFMKNPYPESVNSYQKYKYATAADYLNMIRGPLTKHGVSFSMDVEANEDSKILHFLLAHSSGQWMRYSMPLRGEIVSEKGNSLDQAWGSHLTYNKKYLLMLVFGLHGDEDDDGASAPQQTQTERQSATPKPLSKKQNYEKFTEDQVKQLMFEIGSHKDIVATLLKNFNVENLADLPKNYYLGIIKKVQEIIATR